MKYDARSSKLRSDIQNTMQTSDCSFREHHISDRFLMYTRSSSRSFLMAKVHLPFLLPDFSFPSLNC